MLRARELPVSPDPIGIARRLVARGGGGLSLLHAAELGGPMSRWSFVAVNPDSTSARIDPIGGDETAPSPRGRAWSWVPRWIGVVPYECRRGLERPGWAPLERRPPPSVAEPVWRRYPAVACVDHVEGRVFAVGVGESEVLALAEALGAVTGPASASAVSLEIADAEPAARHLERIAAAQELIRRGDLYQVNLARAIAVRVLGGSGPGSEVALALHERLVRAAPTPLASCLELPGGVTVLSTSPELLLRAETLEAPAVPAAFGRLLTAPIKGTRPRGTDAESDAALVRELEDDPKERAELTMIVDVERHDLGRVAEVGSVRIVAGPRVVAHRTVLHREAWIAAHARAGASREEVLASMLPSGSVTGAPKVRAMEVIAALEGRRRGLYTGGIGFVAHDGSATFAMAIRTITLVGSEGEYLTGGGIVVDSDPLRELEETRWKALQLERAAKS